MKLKTLVFILLLTGSANAQMESWVEARGKAGFLAAHRAIMGHIPEQHAFAAEFSYYFRGNGEQYWHDAYHKPLFGISTFVGSVGNMDLMGLYFGAYGFASIPFVRGKHYSFSGRLGTGLGYGQKIYDPDNNIFSIAVSTHLNALVSLGIENRWEFGRHAINNVIDMTHFSNGATKVPNLGLNLPYISLGYAYKVREHNENFEPSDRKFSKHWEFGGVAFASVKEVFPTGEKKYPVFGLNAVARRYFKPAVGMEVSFDYIHKQAIMAYHSDVPKTQAEIIQLGIFSGYLLPFDRFHLVVGMGYYVRDKFQPEDFLYHRVGMRYVFDNGLNLNLVLKSHWARADYIEYGIGYTFRK